MNTILQFSAFEGTFALAFVAGILAIGVGFLLIATYLEHRREMALIDAGAYEQVTGDSIAWVLGAGLLVTAVGLGNVVETVVTGGQVGEGITLLFVGLAALVYYGIKRRQQRAADRRDGNAGENGTGTA